MKRKYLNRSESRDPFWLVRFPIVDKQTFDRITISKFFYDKHYRNKDDAFQDALEYRDYLIRCYGWPVNKPIKPGLRSNNRSGTSGVHHTKFIRKKSVNGRTYRYLVDNWVATWAEKGKTNSKSFPISKHGYNGAYELALDYRIKKEEELLNAIKGEQR